MEREPRVPSVGGDSPVSRLGPGPGPHGPHPSVNRGPRPDVVKGFLSKWTNYYRGYQRRWFILSGGVLYYYKSPNEVELTCRGSMSLVNCQIESSEDSTGFQILAAQTWHLRATSEVDKQRWVLALQLAREKAIEDAKSSMIMADEEEDAVKAPDLTKDMINFNSKLVDIKTLKTLIIKHQNELNKELNNLTNSISQDPEMQNQIKVVTERATLVKVTCNTMVGSCADLITAAEDQKRRWERALAYEKNQVALLQRSLEEMANTQNQIDSYIEGIRATGDALEEEETTSSGVPINHVVSDEEDEFFDATETAHVAVEETIGEEVGQSGDNDSIESERKIPFGDHDSPLDISNKRVVARRETIPDRPKMNLNLWKILKSCVGKDLSRIPMPVNFNEPLTFLQRLAEDLEYSSLLDTAAKLESSIDQLAYVGAFALSVFSCTIFRHNKPFNPLLHETYELDLSGESEGFRVVTEQVRHHPPISAQYVEGRGWIMNQEYSMNSSFRGKYMTITPTGIQHVLFPKHPGDTDCNHYYYTKPETVVDNIIVGTLSLYQRGSFTVHNWKTKEKLVFKFHVPAFSSRVPHKVTAEIFSAEGEVVGRLDGNYNGSIEYDDNKSLRPRTIWTRNEPCNEEKYFFSKFAMMLNQKQDGIAPTDSRLRKDVRLLEEGAWEMANTAKENLENRQRDRRKLKMAENPGEIYIEPPPVWFKSQYCPQRGCNMYTYQNQYWHAKQQKDFSRCTDIYEDIV